MYYPELERGSERYKRTKRLFEGRKRQFAELRENCPDYPYPNWFNHAYAHMVAKYTRAHQRWRNARGWR